MAYTVKYWALTEGRQEEASEGSKPSCPGDFVGPKCGDRPKHVVTWVVNGTGLPNLGAREVYYPCAKHIDRLLVVAEVMGRFAVVSAYKEV